MLGGFCKGLQKYEETGDQSGSKVTHNRLVMRHYLHDLE